MKLKEVKSAFGIHFIDNNWKDKDWDNYQFNLKLRESICSKVLVEHRKLNKDEKKFIVELEEKNEAIRTSYKVVAK